MTSPRRGEVWLVDLGMAAKVRPALVISIPAEDADRALVTLVPHTMSPRQSRLHDPEVFRHFEIHPEFHTLVWANGADFAPEFLYDSVRVTA